LSSLNFINTSIVEVNLANWPGFPSSSGQGMAIFGSGKYRQSNVYFAYQNMSNIGTATGIQYFAGLVSGNPTWTSTEANALALFNQSCVGELSVTYNQFIKKWLMTYNCDQNPSQGVNFRTANNPWGPWSQEQVMFNDWTDNGYCHFIHVDWNYSNCDNAFDAGREYQWGGDYGPYQFPEFAKSADSTQTTIYYTMSTWNPYTVVLMKTTLELQPVNLQVVQDACPNNGLTFFWENSGSGWYMDISDDPGFSYWYNKNISGLTSTSAPENFASNLNANNYLDLQPQKTYYWRVWNGYRETSGGSFTIPLCTYTNTNCSGTFDDTGGSSASYSGNEDYTTIIRPSNAASVTMNFSSFDIELNYDSMWIYNGLPNSSLIGIYTGTSSPGTVTANTGIMSVRFKADPLVNNSGWTANWNCVPLTSGIDKNTSVYKAYIYPSIGEGEFTVNTPGSKIKNVSVYNSLGEMVYKTQEDKIDLRNFPTGSYIVFLETEQTTFRDKIIVAK
jgi:hypothetical protein